MALRRKPSGGDHHFSAQLLRTGGAARLRLHLKEIAKRRRIPMGQALIEVVEEAWRREVRRDH